MTIESGRNDIQSKARAQAMAIEPLVMDAATRLHRVAGSMLGVHVYCQY